MLISKLQLIIILLSVDLILDTFKDVGILLLLLNHLHPLVPHLHHCLENSQLLFPGNFVRIWKAQELFHFILTFDHDIHRPTCRQQ